MDKFLQRSVSFALALGALTAFGRGEGWVVPQAKAPPVETQDEYILRVENLAP